MRSASVNGVCAGFSICLQEERASCALVHDTVLTGIDQRTCDRGGKASATLVVVLTLSVKAMAAAASQSIQRGFMVMPAER